MVMQTVDLAFEEFGHSGLGHPPLVILHGFFASSRNWRLMAQKLSGQRHTVVLDLRNHGRSPHHSLMDYPSMSADVLAFMARMKWSKVSLLGHSMGGKVAMWLALKQPQRVEKLVVADIAPVGYPHNFKAWVMALKSLPLAELSNRKQAETFLAEAIPDVAYRQFLLQNLWWQENRYAWRIDLDIFATAAPAIAAFPETLGMRPFTGKALFVAGANSSYVKAKDVLPMFPDAILNYVEKAGHWLHVEQPEAFIRRVEAFLADG